jgi:hypothetical protein
MLLWQNCPVATVKGDDARRSREDEMTAASDDARPLDEGSRESESSNSRPRPGGVQQSTGAQSGTGPIEAAGAHPRPGTQPKTGAEAVVADAVARTGSHVATENFDPARRSDVLFRVRGGDDHQPSVWWMIGAFVVVAAGAVILLSFVPG